MACLPLEELKLFLHARKRARSLNESCTKQNVLLCSCPSHKCLLRYQISTWVYQVTAPIQIIDSIVPSPKPTYNNLSFWALTNPNKYPYIKYIWNANGIIANCACILHLIYYLNFPTTGSYKTLHLDYCTWAFCGHSSQLDTYIWVVHTKAYSQAQAECSICSKYRQHSRFTTSKHNWECCFLRLIETTSISYYPNDPLAAQSPQWITTKNANRIWNQDHGYKFEMFNCTSKSITLSSFKA